MGDRATIAFTDGTGKAEPIGVYVHWHGERSWVEKIIEKMKERKVRTIDHDPAYAIARFVQEAANDIPGELSIGVIEIDGDLDYKSDDFFRHNNNGDNGIYVIGPCWEITFERRR